MALIFFLSAQPHLGTDLGTLDVIGRKLAHMVEYGVLWFLWWRALGRENALAAAAIALLYAISDEFHQTFVDGRQGSPVDVLIDSAGIAIAWAITTRSGRGGRKRGGGTEVRPGPDGETQAKSGSSQARTQATS